MTENTITIQIDKPIHDVFSFAITPPNSARWIPDVITEETSDWPIRVGTVYRLQNKKGEWSEVIVTAIKENDFVEWTSRDKSYHCKYTFRKINENLTRLIYREWVDNGELYEPFTKDVLQEFKRVIEITKS